MVLLEINDLGKSAAQGRCRKVREAKRSIKTLKTRQNKVSMQLASPRLAHELCCEYDNIHVEELIFVRVKILTLVPRTPEGLGAAPEGASGR